MPSSSATARRLRPLACARRTASARNSSVKCFLSSAIGDLLLHGKSSPLLRSKSNRDLTHLEGVADLSAERRDPALERADPVARAAVAGELVVEIADQP